MANMLTKTSWLLAGRAVGDGLSFVFYIAIARRFGDGGIGDYAFAFAIATLCSLGVAFGFGPMIIRSVARNRDRISEYMGNLFVLQFGLAIAIGLALFGAISYLEYSENVVQLCIVAFAASAIQAIGTSHVAFLQARDEMLSSAKLEVVAKFSIVIVGFSILAFDGDIETIVWAHVIGYSVYLALTIASVRKVYQFETPNLNILNMHKMLVDALPFAGGYALYVIYSRIDIVMIFNLVGDAEAGLYSVAVRCIETALVLPTMVGVAMYPRLSMSGEIESAERRALFLGTLKWLVIVGAAGSAGLITASSGIIDFLFGDEFEASGALLQWMSLLLVISCVKVPYARLMLATNREYLLLKIQFGSICLNVVLNLMLIPRYGALGAAVASIASESLMTAMLHYICSRVISADYLRLALKTAIVWCAAVLIGTVCANYLHWSLVIPVSSLSFLAMALALRLVTAADFSRVRGLLSIPGS